MDSWRDSIVLTDDSSNDSNIFELKSQKKNVRRIIDSDSDDSCVFDSNETKVQEDASLFLADTSEEDNDEKSGLKSETDSEAVFLSDKTLLLEKSHAQNENDESVSNSINSTSIAFKTATNSLDQSASVDCIIDDSDCEEQESPKESKPTLNMAKKQAEIIDLLESPAKTSKQQVSRLEYVDMKQKLEEMYTTNRRLQQALKTIDLNTLPDRGATLLAKQKESEDKITDFESRIENVVIKSGSETPTSAPSSWRGIEQAATQVQPRTFGKQAMETYNNEKALTLDRLHSLHSSLETCPTPETLADDPDGLTVDLMMHQKQALAWMQWREKQKPAGGILADDMGLGKTLSMISLICADNEESDEDDENDEDATRFQYRGGTLVVCPASLMGQWVQEIKTKLTRNKLSVETYHGPKRETKAKRLRKYDVVVTTYAICQSEATSETPLYRIKWHRIILDEAHQIRNHKSKTALAVFGIVANRRWALTGTPVHNKELDLFALLRFLRCSPFDDLNVFKRWIAQKASGGNHRLHTVLSSLLLRRTKEQLQDLKQLTCLPERHWQMFEVQMDEAEMAIYQKILLFSKTMFAQFLHQRAEKNADMLTEYNEYNVHKFDPSSEYYKMHQKLVKMNKLPDVKSSDILVLLLRLRQICCHPSLITAMLDNVADLGEDLEDADVSINLLDQLNKLNLSDEFTDENSPADGLHGTVPGVGLAEASRGILNPANPIFEKERVSTKLRAVLKLLEDAILPTDDKVIIVSQWTSYLRLLLPHLQALNVKCCQLDGNVQVHKRGEIVSNFNDANSDVRIMLLSLTAGGVGLNLVGANHLLFLDLHWNPQLEMQAQDRIYRLGQKKKVNIYKFMTLDTIEQRIKKLQDNKLQISDAMLKGAKMQLTKLSLDDLKMLFNM